jgi:peroxidase
LKWPGAFSAADCIAIAAAAAVAANGGPLVNVGYGRPDAHGPDVLLGVGTHGDVGKDLGIEGLLSDWMAYGFTPRTLCILSGGHTMGISGQAIPQSRLGDPAFNNGYYRDVLAGRGFFASDKALADSPLTLRCVQQCAQSQAWFFEEWKREFFEMTWWGTAEQGVLPKGLEGREFFKG